MYFRNDSSNTIFMLLVVPNQAFIPHTDVCVLTGLGVVAPLLPAVLHRPYIYIFLAAAVACSKRSVRQKKILCVISCCVGYRTKLAIYFSTIKKLHRTETKIDILNEKLSL